MQRTSQLGSIDDLLAAPGDAVHDAPQALWGFGGLHGGLTAARLLRTMGAHAAGGALQYLHANFARPVQGPFTTDIDGVRTTRRGVEVAAAVRRDGQVLVSAGALFEAPDGTGGARLAPPPPEVGAPLEADVFTVPPAFVPFAAQTEIRPVGRQRPFAGGREPVLAAWIRLLDDERPPDDERLIVLLDALAPSYAAVLTVPTSMPTVRLSVQLGDRAGAAASPWVLISARTHAVTGGRWVDERLDAWAPDGTHLASGHQLRCIVEGLARAGAAAWKDGRR